MRTRWAVLVLVAALLGGGFWYCQNHQNATAQSSSEKVTLAYYGGCYGGSCNGLDPSKNCTDGRTVASMDVQRGGLLELRYSPSCKANWGRYTPYQGRAITAAAMGQTIYARVTAWNPGGKSYGTAHRDLSIPGTGSSWSQLVDGVVTACTGVEIVVISQDGDDHKIAEKYPDGQPNFSGEAKSQGWTWGPCR